MSSEDSTRMLCGAHNPQPFEALFQSIPVLDESRNSICRRIAETLQSLCAGELKGRNSFNLLLLGRKCVGKTTILDAVRDSLQSQEDILVQTVDFSNDRVTRSLNHSGNLVGFLAESEIDYVEDLEDHLVNSEKRMVILLDELQTIFTDLYEKRTFTHMRSTLLTLVGNSSGRFHVIASGSSKYLRALCFNKLDEEFAKGQGFIHFRKGVDFNST